MFSEVFHPPALMILQAVTGPLYFDEPIAPLIRIELHKIGKAARIAFQISEHAFEHASQVNFRNAMEGKFDQLDCESFPEYERIVRSNLRLIGGKDACGVLIAIKHQERALKDLATPLHEHRAPQIGWPALEGVKERARHWMKDGIPAPETEERVDQ
jgi:hypothetical protein